MPGTMKLCTSKSTVTAKACSVARLARHNVVCRASSGSCTSNGVVAQSSGSAQQAVVSAMLAANLFMSNVAFAADAIEVSAEVATEPVAQVSVVAAPAPELVSQIVAAPDIDMAAEPSEASAAVEGLDIPAMPAINADTNVKVLVDALIRNEQFIAALVNNEAFLDRLAGEDKVLQELARRKSTTEEIETRDELATELKRRKDVLGALAARGQEAVLAVADAAKKAADDAMKTAATEAREADKSGEVGVVSSGKSALIAMETAVELLEDSQELLAAMASDSDTTQRQMDRMEAAVARAEKSVTRTLEKNAAEPLSAVQDAVKELYGTKEAASKPAKDNVTIDRAYGDLISAVAELQRAYGSAVAKAVGHAVSEVVEVEEAAVVGAGKAKVVLEQKVAEVNRIVGGGKVAKVQVVGPDGTVVEQDDPSAVREAQFKALRIPVLAALLFFIWAAFIAPKARRV